MNDNDDEPFTFILLLTLMVAYLSFIALYAWIQLNQ